MDDKSIIRKLAEEKKEISLLQQQNEKALMWQTMNDLGKVRPLVWINEFPWHEMNYNDELTLQCQDDFWRGVEWGLRTELYQWRHLPGDMVITPDIYVPLSYADSGILNEDVDIVKTDDQNGVVSRHFHIQIAEEEDIEKIHIPEIRFNREESESNIQRVQECIGDILTVKPRGALCNWFAPWDELIRWTGVQEGLLNLALKPDLIHKAMNRLTNAYLARLDQYEKFNLLSLNNSNNRIGSGAYGYTKELPSSGFDSEKVRTMDMWSHATAQIFSDVSPEMHEEFGLQYESRWLSRFGLTYYGCCEPLHLKIDVLKKNVPNLRKVSMSPWADLDAASDKIGDSLVMSIKPNPAYLAENRWRPDAVRADLRSSLEKTSGCVREVVLKDISTIKYEPKRLWEWADIAMEEVQRAEII